MLQRAASATAVASSPAPARPWSVSRLRVPVLFVAGTDDQPFVDNAQAV
jgi:hypothetical protein